MSRLQGPDVSHWQGMIHWVKMASMSDFAIVRIGDAISLPYYTPPNYTALKLYLDRQYDANWDGATAQGLPFGTYWFWRGMVSPERQADAILMALEGRKMGLPLFVDVEDTNHSLTVAEASRRLYKLMTLLDAQIPHDYVGIYTSQGYWYSHVRTYPADDLQGRPLWVASWRQDKPLMPYRWPYWTFWQYGVLDDGREYGAQSKSLDHNYYYGTRAQFEAQFGGSGTTPPPPPPPPPSGERVRVTHSGVRVRGSASANAGEPILGLWQYGAVLNIEETVTGSDGLPWHKVTAYIAGDFTEEVQ